jgi:hypothetical protein
MPHMRNCLHDSLLRRVLFLALLRIRMVGSSEARERTVEDLVHDAAGEALYSLLLRRGQPLSRRGTHSHATRAIACNAPKGTGTGHTVSFLSALRSSSRRICSKWWGPAALSNALVTRERQACTCTVHSQARRVPGAGSG